MGVGDFLECSLVVIHKMCMKFWFWCATCLKKNVCVCVCVCVCVYIVSLCLCACMYVCLCLSVCLSVNLFVYDRCQTTWRLRTAIYHSLENNTQLPPLAGQSAPPKHGWCSCRVRQSYFRHSLGVNIVGWCISTVVKQLNMLWWPSGSFNQTVKHCEKAP